MACQRSTQTASNCQSNALSPFRRVPSLVSTFVISARKSLDDSPADAPPSRLSDGCSWERSFSGRLISRQPADNVAVVSPEVACRSDSRPSDDSPPATSQSFCPENSSHQEATFESTYPKESTLEPTLEFSLESSSLADRSFDRLPFTTNIRPHNRLSSFSSDQQLCSTFSTATFPKALSDFRVVAALRPINLINSIFFIFIAGLEFAAHLSRHFRPLHQPELIKLVEQFKLAFCDRRTALISSRSAEISKAAVSEQPTSSEAFSRATISKQPDYIINYKSVSFNCRSFFKLWPFHFLLCIRLVFAKLHNSFRALPRNGAIQLLLILGISATPVSANLKVSVQGDILLGGIFPVHQKGKRRDVFKFYWSFVENLSLSLIGFLEPPIKGSPPVAN